MTKSKATPVTRPFLPWVTFSIFLITLLCYAGHPEGWPFEFALLRIHPWTLIGSLVSHSSLPHLMGNMLYLILFGPVVEKRLGTARYAALYLCAGIASIWGFGVFYPTDSLVGASGAISGLIAVYPFVQTNWISRLIAGVCAGYLLFGEFTQALQGPFGRVANLGHVAGAVGGLLMFCYYRALHARTR